MNKIQLATIAIEYLLVPIAKKVIGWGLNRLKSSKDGIPKKLILTVVNAIADDQNNEVTHTDFDHIKEKIVEVSN